MMMANMAELPLSQHQTDADVAPPPPSPAASDTPPGDAAHDGDAGRALAHSAPNGDTATPTTHGVSERDAALLLDMKEPVGSSTPDQREPEPEHTPASRVSILNAASDTSDGEDAAAVAARGDSGRDGTDISTHKKPTGEGEEEEEEDVLPPRYGEKGITYSLSELFVNPNLKLKSANVVLKKDPFAIPRATDNVTEYRPRFNPLSILMSEEKLLPRNFTFDFSEGIPGEPKHQGGKQGKTLGKRGGKDLQGRASRSNSDFDASSLLVRKSAPPPVRNPQVFGDKLSTMGLLMGSMPRQPQASPKPLINTPTVHNPFGEPLLELVVNNDPPVSSDTIAMQRLRAVTAPSAPVVSHLYPEEHQQPAYIPTPSSSAQAPLEETLGAEFDAFGVDMHNISNLSKLSIAANNVAAADSTGSFHGPAYATTASAVAPPPLTPPAPALYDGLANYLPNHFAEKRVSHMLIDPALYDVPTFHGEHTEHTEDHYQQQQHQYQHQELHRHSGYEDNYDASVSMTLTSTPAHSDYESHHYLHQQHHPNQSDSLQPVAKKPRSKNMFRPCTHPGCTKGARGKSGLCQKHGGGKRCGTPNCPKGAQGSSKYCLFHGGGYRCTVPGCATGARGTSGLCAKHGGYKRAREGAGSGNDEAEDEVHGDGGPADKKPRMEAYEGRALEASG